MTIPGSVAATHVDFLVLGAGVAGLRAALSLAEQGTVLLVAKDAVAESNTHYAQGGIAVAMDGDADVALHLEDTIAAGDGLVFRPAAEALVQDGPRRVAELIEWGARFDREDGDWMRTREGAHSRARILHAFGDATGAEMGRALRERVRTHRQVHIAERQMAVALRQQDGRVVGADLLDESGQVHSLRAKATLLATGGAGQIYCETTNPAVATGDGLALALQAGAELADMEFYQFHPTALHLAGAPRFLLSEALRGEGAQLVNERGERFMRRYHPLLELAPRDVVARAIVQESVAGDFDRQQEIYLDMRSAPGVAWNERFPTISAVLARYGLSLSKDRIPVYPAAHYLMGGVRTDLAGRTTVPGLYAAGEVAATGVHGANRLASNSLLEGLVFGARSAEAMLADTALQPVADNGAISASECSMLAATDADRRFAAESTMRMQQMLWSAAGLFREEATMRRALAELETMAAELRQRCRAGRPWREGLEAMSIAAVGRAVLECALARRESRGAHARLDYPRKLPEYENRHTLFSLARGVHFEQW